MSIGPKFRSIRKNDHIKQGDYVYNDGEKHFVAQVGHGLFMAVCMNSANRWSEPYLELPALKNLLIKDGFKIKIKGK